MPTGKTSTLTIRLEPDLKEALRAAAIQEHRSIANMVEVMIRAHCDQSGILVERASPKVVHATKPNARHKRT